jgi:hypothetical protein
MNDPACPPSVGTRIQFSQRYERTSKLLSRDQAIVFAVSTDPEPDDVAAILD